MPRRIYIVDQIGANTAADAAANNCPEIVVGIPPVLQVELNGVSLPRVYEEPESSPVPCPCTYIPSVEGEPKEIPLVLEGHVPVVYDATNFRLYAHVNGTWKYTQFNV